MDQFPANSRSMAAKKPVEKRDEYNGEDERMIPKLESVVSGKVIKRKKPLGRRFINTFFAGDGVMGYLGKEVLLPALQNLITDFVTQGVNRAVYGDAAPARTTRGSAPRTHVSYNQPSSIVRPATSTPATRRPVTQPSAFDIGDLIVGSKIEADMICEKLYETVEEYGAATVANLNDLIGQTSAYTDHKWGWTDLERLSIAKIREGFLIKLPEPEDLR